MIAARIFIWAHVYCPLLLSIIFNTNKLWNYPLKLPEGVRKCSVSMSVNEREHMVLEKNNGIVIANPQTFLNWHVSRGHLYIWMFLCNTTNKSLWKYISERGVRWMHTCGWVGVHCVNVVAHAPVLAAACFSYQHWNVFFIQSINSFLLM